MPAECTGRQGKKRVDFGFVCPLAMVQLLVFSAAFQMMVLSVISPRIRLLLMPSLVFPREKFPSRNILLFSDKLLLKSESLPSDYQG